jgi:hypothetical protein
MLIVPLGEDALANLSIERLETGAITGHVRIRSKTQGIALSLGDRITMGMNVVPQFRTTPLIDRPSAKRQQDPCEALDTLHYFRLCVDYPIKLPLKLLSCVTARKDVRQGEQRDIRNVVTLGATQVMTQGRCPCQRQMLRLLSTRRTSS